MNFTENTLERRQIDKIMLNFEFESLFIDKKEITQFIDFM